MLSYCLKCRNNTDSKNPKVVKAKHRKIMFLSKCAVCDSKKSRFIKKQEASGLLSSLGIKTPLSENFISRSSLVLWFILFSIKKTSGGTVKNENMSNQELVEELHKPIIRKFEKQKVQSPFIESPFICNADLVNMQLISNLIQEFLFYYMLLIFLVDTLELFL